MLRQASVEELRKGAVRRADGHVVIAMRRYPRGLRKVLRDEYVRGLSPAPELLDDFLARKKELAGDHEQAFVAVDYERRFALDEDGRAHLTRLAELARTRDVYLVCQCGPGDRCHRDLLLLEAQARFGVDVEPPRFAYPTFEERVRAGSVGGPVAGGS